MTIEQLRMAIMKFLGSQPERFPDTPNNLAADVIGVWDNDKQAQLLLIFVPEVKPERISAAFEHAALILDTDDRFINLEYPIHAVWVAVEFVRGAPKLLPDSRKCRWWIVYADHSVTEYEAWY